MGGPEKSERMKCLVGQSLQPDKSGFSNEHEEPLSYNFVDLKFFEMFLLFLVVL